MAATFVAPPTATPKPARSARRLGRRSRRAVLIAHVLASVGWFGVAGTVAFVGVVGASRDDLAFTEVIQTTLWLSVPLGLLSAATGVVLSLTSRWGLGRHWWVVVKELGAVAVIATDVLVVAPTMADAIDAGRPGELPGPIFAHCVVLALATVLSVVKPKARTPWARPADEQLPPGGGHPAMPERPPALAGSGGLLPQDPLVVGNEDAEHVVGGHAESVAPN